jgi:hypothetical protein
MLLNSAGGINQPQGQEFKSPQPMQLGNSSLNLNGGVPMPQPKIDGNMANALPSPITAQQQPSTNPMAMNPGNQISPENKQLQQNMHMFLTTDQGQEMIKKFSSNGYPQYAALVQNAQPPTSGTINPASQMMYNSGLASTPYSNSTPQNSPAQNQFDQQYYASLLNNNLNKNNNNRVY